MIDDQIRDAFTAADTSAPPDLLDDLGRRLALEFDAVAGPTPLTAPTRPRRGRAAVAAGIATAVAAALVGAVIVERDRTPSAHVDVQAGPSATNAPKSSARALALAYAQHLLDVAALPPRTRTSPSGPAIAVTRTPFPAPRTQVELRQDFTAPKSQHDAAIYLQRHPTPGTQVLDQGSTTVRGVTTLDVDHGVIAPPGDIINSARIVYTVSATGPNTSTILVDAVVVWGPRHPHIPARDKVVTVKGVIPSRPPKSRTVVVTDPSGVAELVTAFEKSATIPIGSIFHCPISLPGAETYTVSYAPSRTAQPDIVVTITDTGCGVAQTEINGHAAPNLMGGNLIAAARAALRR